MFMMQKIKMVGYLSALSTVMFASVATAGTIVNSAHDFSTKGWNTVTDEICIFCHTPHNSDTTVTLAPLWNHELTSTGDFTIYSSATLTAVVDQPGGISILCLSCHDGTVAVDAFGGDPGGAATLPDRVNLTKDLSDDHPISFTYNAQLATDDGGLVDPTVTEVTIGTDKTKTGFISDLMLFGELNDRLECASCHDVHNTFASEFFLLRVDNTGSALCLTCHSK